MYLPDRTWRLVAAAALLAAASHAQELRFANGMPLKGEPVEAINDGLVVKIGTTTKTFPWETLSPATRYRYQIFYRSNFDQVLTGISSANWSNSPDKIYRPFGSKGPAKEEAQETNTAAAAGSGATLVLDMYEVVPPMAPIDIPKLEIRAMDLAQFWSVQYGPTRKDVAVFAFDTKGAGELHDMLFVHTAVDDRTDKIRGAKRTDKDDTYMEFRRVPLQTQFGGTKATLDVECWFASKQAGVQARCETELVAGETKSSFVLRGTPAGVVQGNNQILTREILAPPVLWFILDTSSGKPLLVGNVRMGKMKLVPKFGMDDKVKLTVLNSVNGIALDQQINVGGADPETKYMIVVDLSRLAENETYAIKASVDLGAFLGPVKFEDRITIPKLGKK
ncbi:MAG TPA: hypothetical protein VIH35_04765 [Kiritimatiellia bacterium]|jgi:hypothetical protein